MCSAQGLEPIFYNASYYVLLKFASLFRGKFRFNNQISFQNSSSFPSSTLGWILSCILLLGLPQCWRSNEFPFTDEETEAGGATVLT